MTDSISRASDAQLARTYPPTLRDFEALGGPSTLEDIQDADYLEQIEDALLQLLELRARRGLFLVTGTA